MGRYSVAFLVCVLLASSLFGRSEDIRPLLANAPIQLTIPEPSHPDQAWILTIQEKGIDVVAEDLDTKRTYTSPIRRGGRITLIPRPGSRIEIRTALASVQGDVAIQLEEVSSRTAELTALEYEAEAAHQTSLETGESRRQAIDLYGRAWAAWHRLDRPRREVEARESRARMLYQSRDMPRAEQEWRTVIQLWDALGETTRKASGLNDLGLILRDMGRSAEAREALQQAQELHFQLGDRFNEATSRNNLCMLDHAAGALLAAAGCYRDVLGIFRDLSDLASEATILNNLGFALDGLGEPVEARQAYDQALALRRRLGDRAAEAQQLNNLAGLDKRAGNFHRSLERYLAAYTIFHDLDDPRQLGSVLHNLGTVYRSLGEHERAVAYLEDAIAMRRRASHRRGEVISLYALGNLLAEAGKFQQALDTHHRALDLAREIGQPRLEANVLLHLGLTALEAERPAVAEPSLNQAIEQLRAIGHPRDEGRALIGRGKVHLALGSLDSARQDFDRAARLFDRLGEPVLLAETQASQARLAAQNGQFDRSMALLDQAEDQLETLRARLAHPKLGASLFQRSQLWEQRIELLMTQHAKDPTNGFDRRALSVSEQIRGRALRELLQNATSGADLQANGSTARQDELQQRFVAKVERLMKLEPRSDDAEAVVADLRILEAELDHLEMEAWNGTSPATELPELNIETLQTWLDPDTALLHFSLGHQRGFVWRVTSNRVDSFELPPRKSLDAAARQVHQDLSTLGPNPAAQKTRNMALSRDLLSQALQDLDAGRLAIVADGALHYLPFAALFDPTRHDGARLIDHYEIVHLPSASVLALQRRVRQDRNGSTTLDLAVLADPLFNAADPSRTHDSPRQTGAPLEIERFPPLSETRREAEAITALVPGDTRLFLGAEASRAKLFSPALRSARMIHLATHGVFDAERPEVSGLILSRVDERGKPQQGFVSLRDLHAQRLTADLVTLSACRTALGRELRGEGLVGVTWGFLTAGAARVAASLWQVRDRATADLMVRFYRGLWQDGLPPAAALRRAQLELRRTPRHRDPYYWGAFVLQGDWR